MKVLFLTPGEYSAGEAITAVHSAKRLRAGGGQTHFLAAGFVAQFAPGDVTLMTEDPAENQASWHKLLTDFAPDAVVFADFCMTFFTSGVAPIGDARWEKTLAEVDAKLFTFDHLGYAQGPMTVFFGPPHLGIVEPIKQPPPFVEVLRPCPVQSPVESAERRGKPFKYWSAPDLSEETKRRVRQRYAKDGYLVFHSVPTWAQEWTARLKHPYFEHLSDLLEQHLSGLDRPVTVVSVNRGDLLAPSTTDGVVVQNLSTLPAEEYEALIGSADLMLTENGVSVSLGKAVMSGVPAAVLKNSKYAKDVIAEGDPEMIRIAEAMEAKLAGAVHPHEVFPIWGKRQVEKLGVFKDSSYVDAVVPLELFGGSATRSRLRSLLTDEATRAELNAKQAAYAKAVEQLPEFEELIT